MGSFVRRVRTASGATAVQIVHKRGRIVLGIDHIGSAHDEGQLAMLLETARAQLHAGQQMLPIEDGPTGGRPIGEPVVEGTASLIVWETLAAVYASLGFDQIGDRAFKALVLARIIEPTSKADTVRVLAEARRARSDAGDVHALPETGDRTRLPNHDRSGLLRARDPAGRVGAGAV